VGVIIKEALANGRLTPRNQSLDFQSQMALLEGQAQRLQTTVDAFALAACLNQPFVDLVLSGAAQVVHLESNLKALQVPWDEGLMEKLQGIRETAKAYWARRSQLDWN
jgi:aryl-alcohol dehydrogenase-like predicted oxidoreductase